MSVEEQLAIMAREIRRLKAEVTELRQDGERVRGRVDTWAANGLEDLDAGHGNQRYFGGDGRLDQTGIQILSEAVGRNPGIFWNSKYKTAPSETTNAATAYLAGGSDDTLETAELYFETDGGAGRKIYVSQNLSPVTAQWLLRIAADGGISRVDVTSLNARGDMQLSNLNFGLSQETSDFTSLGDGNLWYRTDTDKIRARINGVTENLATESYVTANAASGYAATMLLMGA